MEKIVPIQFEGKQGSIHEGDAIVEYVELIEEGVTLKEITFIYLPDGISKDQIAGCKAQAVENFYIHHTKGGQ